MPPKLDLYKLHEEEYVQSKTPALVRAKLGKYLALEGQGAPDSHIFTSRVGALYMVAFTLKMEKKASRRDFRVCGLEGFWWSAGSGHDFFLDPPDTWCWRFVIRVPDWITSKDVKKTVKYLLEKGKPAEVADVVLAKINEGLSVQMLHVGPYNTESVSIGKMMSFAHEKHLEFHGLHHELYISDPRRVAPERLRTILRMPVRKPA